MISLEKTGNAIKFTFDDNGRYLYNGTIEVPVNSLTLVTDGSDMFTFKKSATNDIFVSGLYSEIGMTKAELISFYKNNMVDSFINADEAQSMIDSSISGKADTSAVTESINAAVSGKASQSDLETVSGQVANKQDTLSAGTGIDITNNVISATGGGGGGKTIEAGRGISVTTGETADTVSFNLPISAGTGTNSLIIGESTNISNSTRAIAIGYKTKAQQSNAFAQGHQTDAGQEQSHAEGYQTKAYGTNSHSEGRGTSAMTSGSHAEGFNTITSNSYEHTQGQYNVSNKASTTFGDSGNTLFSVGNGTANDARHNAFEIRQNGDVYLNDGTNDVKLQDYLQIKVVKLTQSAYDALSPDYDSNTLYVIVN